MTKLFIDANVLISVLNKEYPIYPLAARVLSLADKPNFQLFASPLSFAITFYFASKKCGAKKAREKIIQLGKKIYLADTPTTALPEIASNKKILDIEDGFQYYAAKKAKCNFIVTQDVDDFYFSEITVLDCEGMLSGVL